MEGCAVVPDSKIVELLLERAWRAQEMRPEDAAQTYGEIVFERPDASPRQVAIAAFNRGLLREAGHDPIGAIHEWSRVAEMRGVPFWLSCVAWMRRGALRYRLGDALGAACDFTAVIVHAAIMETRQEAVIDARVYVPRESSPLELMGLALVERGRARMYLGDDEGALRDISAAQGLAGISAAVVTRALARIAEVHLAAGRYAAAVEAVEACVKRNAAMGFLRVLSAFAFIGMGQPRRAVAECEAGLAWVRSTARLDFLEGQLAAMLRGMEVRGGTAVGVADVRERLDWRRQELETYAPTREADREL